jgi:alcohol dehydrogenase
MCTKPLDTFRDSFLESFATSQWASIVAVAPDVTTRKVGDRIGSAWILSTCGRCEWCQRGRRMFCPYLKGTGGDAQGGHAEYMLMNADATYLIPDKVSYEQAAPIFCAGYTVYSGLRWADPQPHERVAVLGIGGLGHPAVQYAKAAGFETIAISHSPDKDKMIRELGADEIVRDGKSLSAAGGADIILSTSNSTKSMMTAFRVCARTAGSLLWAPTRNRFRSRWSSCSSSASKSSAASKMAPNISTKPWIT